MSKRGRKKDGRVRGVYQLRTPTHNTLISKALEGSVPSDARMVRITEDLIHAGATTHGNPPVGWNFAQLQLLRVDSLTKGWKQRLVGTLIPYDDARRFLELRGHCHNRKVSRNNHDVIMQEGWEELAAKKGVTVEEMISLTIEAFLAPLVV